ncbi:MAG TPA: hypothetical protein VMH49_03540, partial [Thermoplasmata archaeon]|nr:hypothetical protein [Thermoplasmata archaeon]
NTRAAVVSVGVAPYGVAYDAGQGEVYVTNYYSNSLSVINDTTDTVVATVPVYQGPWGVTYDTGRGEVFVTNAGSDNVSVLSTATYSVSFTTNPRACGTIAFDGTLYVDAASARVPAGYDMVSARTCPGYALQSLVGTGSVTVSTGGAVVTGAGGVTATFVKDPVVVGLTGDEVYFVIGGIGAALLTTLVAVVSFSWRKGAPTGAPSPSILST